MTGTTPLSWQEIRAWVDVTKTEVPSYEAGLIRDLSIEYCNQFHESHKKNVPKPVDADEVRSYRKDVSIAFSRMLERYAK